MGKQNITTATGPELKDSSTEAYSDAAADLAAIKEDWGAVWNDFDQIRMDADFDF